MKRVELSIIKAGEQPMWSIRRNGFRLSVLCFGLLFTGAMDCIVTAGDDLPAFEVSDRLIPMSDGIELATTVYRPHGDGPFPVVVARTPYNKDGQKAEAERFCRNG